jgi:hypothetical protein
MSEQQSVWGRHAAKRQRPIDDLGKNSFERHRDALSARGAAAVAEREKHEQARQVQRTNYEATHQLTTGNLVMDGALTSAHAAYVEDRAARKNQPATEVRPETSARALQACIEFWQRNSESGKTFHESEFNYASLTRCFVARVFGRGLPATPEEVSEAYSECLEKNCLELPRRIDGNGATIRRRGEPSPLPPTLYPQYVWPAQEQAARDAEFTTALAQMMGTDANRKREDSNNRQKSLSELQAEVRAGYRDKLPLDVRGSGVV